MYSYKNIKKKKGQATLEAVLLMVMLLSIAFAVKDGINTGGWMKKIVETPGNRIRGMSIAGAWTECTTPPVPPSSGGCSAMAEHPNQQPINVLHVQGESVE